MEIGWLDQMEIRLTSASVEVEVELSWVKAELSNILYMEKCCMDKCCMVKWYWVACQQSRMVKNLVKIWSVTAEIFLIWTNVTLTNVAWTNVPMTFVIYGLRNLPLKFGQNRISNSWDIPDMEKCCQRQMFPRQMSPWQMVPGTYR